VEQALARAATPVLLWIDNFEHVADRHVDDSLLDLLWRASRAHLIVAVRGQERFAGERYRDLDATVLTASDLAFTAEETAQLFAQLFAAAGAGAPPELVDGAQAELGGWPEPTRALALSLRDEPAGDQRRAVDAFATNYFRSRLLPEPGRPDRLRFALRTALAGRFTPDLAASLTDDPAVAEHAAWYRAEGLLQGETIAGQPTYRWPAAARSLLTAELHARMPEQVAELHTRLARGHLDAGEVAAALRHAVAAPDWPLALEIVDSSWRRLLFENREELHRALVAIPVDAVPATPKTAALRALFQPTSGGIADCLRTLPESADELAQLGRADDALDILDTGLAALVAVRDHGAPDDARAYGERLLQVATAARAARPAESASLYPAALVHVGVARLLSGDYGGAVGCLAGAHERAGDSPSGHLALEAAGQLALAHALQGELRETAAWLSRYEAAPRPPAWLLRFLRVPADTARLLISVDALDLPEASAVVDALDGEVQRDQFWTHHLYARGLLALHTGAAADVLQELDRARAGRQGWLDHPASAPLLAAAEADLLLALGRGTQARSLLHGPHAKHPLLRVGQARLALLAGHSDEALRLTADAGWERGAPTRHRLEMLLIRAVAAHRGDDRSAATQALASAVAGARRTGALRPFTTVPRDELTELAKHVPEAADLLAEEPLASAAGVYPSSVDVIRLTRREQQVLERLAAGLSMQQVSVALRVSYSTARTQQRSLYRKLGVTSQADAVALARQHGLLADG
jgi:LuxR family maltose regulon positive regulatory protein